MNTEEKNPQTEAGTDPQTDAEPEASQETEKAEKKDKGGFGGKKAKAEKEAMQKKLEEAEEALKKQKDQFLRTAAEYDNYRKRTEREKAAIYSDATAAAVLEFLPVADNLERAGAAGVQCRRPAQGRGNGPGAAEKSAGKAGRVRDGRRRGGVQPGTAQRRIPY